MMLNFHGLKEVAPETWAVWLVLCINILNFLAFSSANLQSAWRSSPRFNKLRSVAASTLKIWLDGIRHYSGKQGEDDPFERKVRILAAEARVNRGRSTSRIFAPVGAFGSFCMMIGFQYYDLGKWFDVDRARWELNQSSFPQLTLVSTMATIFSIYPTRMTARSLNLWHCLVFLRICWQVYTAESLYQFFALEHTQGGFRVFTALGLGTPLVTLGLNTTCSLSKVWVFHRLYEALNPEEQDFVYSYWGDVRTFLIHEVFVCASTWAVNVIVDSWNYASVRAELQAKASSTSEKTVKSMLVVLCDVVVTVNEDLLFDNPATEIAQFLLRQPLNNSYKGSSFLELVEASDRERVCQQITSSLIGHGTTLSVSARLVDGNGNLLNVRMYCTCFSDINDSRAYIIGLLELKDPTNCGRLDSMSAGEANETINNARGRGALHTSIEWDRDSFKTSSIDSAMIPLAGDEDELEIWIDLAEDAMPVVDVSHLVRTMTGPETCIGVSFLDWLRQAEAADVVSRISDAFLRLTQQPQTCLPLATQADLGSFHLRPVHAARAGLEYVVHASMDVTRLLESNGTATGPVCVCLRLDDIAVQKLGRLRKRSKSSAHYLQEDFKEAEDPTGTGSSVSGSNDDVTWSL
eukprot:TRINITY_DN7885_c0_g1_i1.p1 TRINITY_DN7885_c0_g1~~TRINITY_DN7885_c0_g1_i1.p1  ORF type:complete len:634 (+),score=75.63 TRINITY_DN7885_c0_g1_i1:78-1979(+)